MRLTTFAYYGTFMFMEGASKIKVYVINLARSKERWDKMAAQLAGVGIPFERIEAVDGMSLSDAEIAECYSPLKNFFCYPRFMSKGEIGCYLSHIKAMRKILHDGVKYGVVLEDDLTVSPELAKLPKILSDIKFDFDCMKLISPGYKKRVIERIEIAGTEFVRWLKPPTYNAAYLMTGNGCKLFCQSRKKFYRPVDVDIQYFWESNLKIVGIFPEMFSFAADSKVSTIDVKGRKKSKTTFPLARLVEEIYYYANALRYRNSSSLLSKSK